jgi:hypothetical protein
MGEGEGVTEAEGRKIGVDRTSEGEEQRLGGGGAEGQGAGERIGGGNTNRPTPDAMRTVRRKGSRNEMVGHGELKFLATFLDPYYIY